MKRLSNILSALVIGTLALPAFADPAALSIINDYRSAKNRAPLVYDPILETTAQDHANDMAAKGYFSHTGADGSSVGDRVRAQGYTWCFVAENIAQGQTSLQQVIAGWKGSAGHYKNMMHKKAQAFGLARGPKNTWVMVLAAPC